jgi:hypothetical protein
MILPIPTVVANLLVVTRPAKPFTCTNKACVRLALLGSPKTYARLTPKALDRAQTYGLSCGWCGHTTTQERRTT